MKLSPIQSRHRAPPTLVESGAPGLSRAQLDYYARRAHYLRSAAFARVFKSTARGLVRGLKALTGALKDARNRRRALVELRRLDDRTLNDIGIERSQIPFVVERLLQRRKADKDPRKIYPLRALVAASPSEAAAGDDERCPPRAA